MLGLFDIFILAIIGIIVSLVFWKRSAKVGSQSTSAASHLDSFPQSPETGRETASSPFGDPRDKPTTLPEYDQDSPTPMGVGWRPTSGSISSPESQQAGPANAAHLFSNAKISGYVRGLGQRTAMPNMQIYSFRVETFDARGNRQPPITVEMKGVSFEGSLNEGDQVEINRRPKPGKAIKISRLTNITAGSVFKAKAHPFIIRILSVPMALIGWIILTAFVVGFFALLYVVIRDLF